MMAELIQGRPHPWVRLYDPARRTNKHFNRGGDTQSTVHSLGDIEPGQGAVIAHGKQKLAVWKSNDGTAHALSAACTHMGCTLTWNNAERTWDCPCHGSMFTREGKVLHGPASKPLEAQALPKNWRKSTRT